ncbi:hypothetical protein FSP39_019793 [Pinctada imbricata]|uniref:Multiple inositol polyphosphate phosphatase 1 n=1 Tax=Pinctada imbricata TaxID=66713 RepID=A0AA88Y8I3_PINIB|nr:hypothetical protein FSP39_019793 [Pinctada imbricata]
MDNLKIVVSSKQRTQASASSFVEGLATSVPVTENDNVEPVIDDIALRFHDNCDKYKVSVDKNDSAMAEYHKFKKGPEVSSLCSEMTEKLGIPIDPDDVNTIFQLCALEEAVTDRDSDWCQFLNEENLQIIQYMNDLKQYWKKAYGYNITASMSCPLVSGMFQRFEDVIRKNEAGKDHNCSNFCDSGDNGEGGGSDDPFSYYVKVLVNEVTIEIPACNDTLCRYEQFRDFYKHYADHCDFHGLCRVDENKHDEL